MLGTGCGSLVALYLTGTHPHTHTHMLQHVDGCDCFVSLMFNAADE